MMPIILVSSRLVQLPYLWPLAEQILRHRISPVQCNRQPGHSTTGEWRCACLPSLEKCSMHPDTFLLPMATTVNIYHDIIDMLLNSFHYHLIQHLCNLCYCVTQYFFTIAILM